MGTYPNKILNIAKHFESFQYNAYHYVLQDCIEFQLNGQKDAGIGRIIDIFGTKQNDAYVLVQMYRCKNGSNGLELILDATLENADIIAIKIINKPIKICDDMHECA